MDVTTKSSASARKPAYLGVNSLENKEITFGSSPKRCTCGVLNVSDESAMACPSSSSLGKYKFKMILLQNRVVAVEMPNKTLHGSRLKAQLDITAVMACNQCFAIARRSDQT